jgi:hypothetical protein
MNKTKTVVATAILTLSITLVTIVKQDTYAIADTPMYFWLKSKLNGMVVDIRGANTAPDTPISTYPQKALNQAINQLWTYTSEGYIKTKMPTGMVLDIRGANTAPDAIVSTYFTKPTPLQNQIWTIVPDGVDGYFWIKSRLNGMVLDIRGANTLMEVLPITTYPQKSFNQAANQLWTIVFPPPP